MDLRKKLSRLRPGASALYPVAMPLHKLLLVMLLFTPFAWTDAAASPGFARHLREAISLNSQRLLPYARLSRGRSLPVSLGLIGSEVLLLPYAAWGDWRALRRGGLAAGAPPLFFPMDGLPEPVRIAPLPRPTRASWRAWRREAAEARRQFRRYQRQGDHAAWEQHFWTHWAALDAYEEAEGVPLAQYRHVLASMGYLYQQAQTTYAAQPKLQRLLYEWIGGHRLLLGSSLTLDRLAQRSQARGVPILIHDLPLIEIARGEERDGP